MSRFLPQRLLPTRLCTSCRAQTSSLPSLARPFSSSQIRSADTKDENDIRNKDFTHALMNNIFGEFQDSPGDLLEKPMTEAERRLPETYHLHVYAHKHNTHLTLTRPDRSPMLSLSAGNLPFKKSGRGEYDAAYQLTNYFLGKMQERGLFQKIRYTEVILRGFGVGREAVTKSLMGVEGKMIRPTIIKVTDATRLKFGGTRSRKPRRLG